MAAEERVDLGFVDLESTEKSRLASHFFPSKVGGKPAWLALKSLPPFSDLKCGVCEKPCVLLLQVYAPDDDRATCFHRTVFVFICKDPACCKQNNSSNFHVFRSQLPRQNDFYSFEPPDETNPGLEFHCAAAEKLCIVCGCAGPKTCSRCHKANYCSKDHQAKHWKAGHKQSCGQSAEAEDKLRSLEEACLFPEYELVMEAEDVPEEEEEKEEMEQMEEYREFMKTTRAAEMVQSADNDRDLEQMSKKETKEDRQFFKFKKRIEHEPEQVLRYQKGGEPLWVSSEAVPTDGDIPNCPCGAPRQFEFQILPQLLTHLKVDSVKDSIDWGTLAVYTCTKNCDEGATYHREVLWKQDIANSSSS